MIINLFSGLLFVLLAVYSFFVLPAGSLQIITLTRAYAFAALGYLLICVFWPKALLGRKQVGFWCLVFALAHASCAFFGQFNGFAGLAFLPVSYLRPMIFGLGAICLLAILVFYKTRFAKILTGLLFGILCIHILIIGIHFSDFSLPGVKLLFLAISLWILLQSLNKKGWVTVVMGFCLLVVSVILFAPKSNNLGSLSLHSQHSSQASDVVARVTSGQITGRRFSVSFIPEKKVLPNKTSTLRFVVNDASSGYRVQLFNYAYEKLMHVIIVDSSLKYFSHIHPEYLGDGEFEISTQFPKSDLYHIYIDFTPVGEKNEQQFGFTLLVGSGSDNSQKSFVHDSNYEQVFGDLKISLETDETLSAKKMSIGQQLLRFHFSQTNSSELFQDLHPYLGAYGHLVMINTQTFEYTHIHPKISQRLLSSDRGGPDIEFLPIGLYSPIQPGVYAVFGQFMPRGTLTVSRYLIKVEP